MDETNFRFKKIERGTRGTDEVIWLQALYDHTVGTLQDTTAQMEVQYTPGEAPKLRSVRLDMLYLVPTPKQTVQFEDGLPVKLQTYNPFPSMTEPKDSTRNVGADYLRENNRYRAMVELIPDTEPIKPVLEKLVR